MIKAEIIDIEETDNQNIWIMICFTQDGVEIPCYYGDPPKLLIRNGHHVWPLTSQLTNFMAKTEAERAEWIDVNIRYIISGFIVQSAKKLKNAEEIAALKSSFTGLRLEGDKTTVAININGREDRMIELTDKGTYTVK